MSTSIMLTFSQLNKYFGKRRILENTGLSLNSGECTLLTGNNGTGKTTLMRILAGLEKPDSGYITVSQPLPDHAPADKSEPPSRHYHWRQYRRRLQQQVMYLHQQPFMFSGDVRHNLNFALPPRLPRAERLRRVEEIAVWAGLEDLLSANAKSLSGGEAQRVAIARARLRNPRALLLDEPSASMDSEARTKMLALLLQLRREKLALLVATHDPEQFRSAATGFLHLEKQQITPVIHPAGTMRAVA